MINQFDELINIPGLACNAPAVALVLAAPGNTPSDGRGTGVTNVPESAESAAISGRRQTHMSPANDLLNATSTSYHSMYYFNSSHVLALRVPVLVLDFC